MLVIRKGVCIQNKLDTAASPFACSKFELVVFLTSLILVLILVSWDCRRDRILWERRFGPVEITRLARFKGWV